MGFQIISNNKVDQEIFNFQPLKFVTRSDTPLIPNQANDKLDFCQEQFVKIIYDRENGADQIIQIKSGDFGVKCFIKTGGNDGSLNHMEMLYGTNNQALLIALKRIVVVEYIY